MSDAKMWAATLGLIVLSSLTRSAFFISRAPLTLPDWFSRGLRYAPLAALAAVIAPDLGLPLLHSAAWGEPAKWAAAAVSVLWALWRADLMGTIVVGMLVYLALKLGGT